MYCRPKVSGLKTTLNQIYCPLRKSHSHHLHFYIVVYMSKYFRAVVGISM